jgi:hypothetical protein
LFPTSVRASAAGWWLASGVLGAVVGLVVFGAVATVDNRFGIAAVITFLPVSLAMGLFWRVRGPEQRLNGARAGDHKRDAPARFTPISQVRRRPVVVLFV